MQTAKPKPYAAQWALNILMAGFTLIFFLVPAGRFYFDLGEFSFSSGFNVYKMFPALFLFWGIWRWHNREKPFPQSPIIFPFCVFFTVSVFSSITSMSPYHSIAESLEILIYLIFFLMLIDLPWNTKYLTWVGTAFLGGTWYLLWRSASQLLYAKVMIWDIKLNGPFDYPNAMGVFCILCSSILIWLAAQCKAKYTIGLIVLTVMAVILCGLLTQSRAVFLSLAAATVVCAALGSRKIQFYVGITLAVMTIAAGLLLLPKFVGMQSELQTQNEMSRLMIWTYMLQNFLPQLPLFGHGLGPTIPERMADWLSSTRYEPYLSKPWHPHNLYLHLLLATGLPGLLAFAWWMRNVFLTFLQNPQIEKCILCAAVAAFLVYQVFEVHLLLGNIPVALITLMAIGTWNQQERSSKGFENHV